MSILQLPIEIWALIIQSVDDLETLRNLMLVNKQFYHFSIPCLYSLVEIDHPKRLKWFLKILNESPDFIEFIEGISFDEHFYFNPIKRPNLISLLRLMNTKMNKLKSFILPSYVDIPDSIKINFQFSEKLVELELMFPTFDLLWQQKIQFPKLKYLMINFDRDFFDAYENLHYLTLPYIEFEVFHDYLFNVDIFDFNEFMAIEKRYANLLSKNHKIPRTYFPQLKEITFFQLNATSFLGDYYLPIVSLIGLPSLQELKWIDCQISVRDLQEHEELLNKALSLRPLDFRFTCTKTFK